MSQNIYRFFFLHFFQLSRLQMEGGMSRDGEDVIIPTNITAFKIHFEKQRFYLL